jgi:hypothetical protein
MPPHYTHVGLANLAYKGPCTEKMPVLRGPFRCVRPNSVAFRFDSKQRKSDHRHV